MPGDLSWKRPSAPAAIGATKPTLFRIGPFQLNTETQVLADDGGAVGLGARASAVLAALVTRADEYVSKSTILEEAWPGLIVEEANLAVQISAIRRTLSRVPGGGRWIETLPRRGYRFVGPVIEVSSERLTAEPSDPSVNAASDVPAGATEPREVRWRVGNLPQVLSPLFGRGEDVVAICALTREHRVVSIVGIGGIGKTRLAQAVAHRRRLDFADGVWMVELASITDPNLIATAASQSLGITLAGKKDPHEEILEALHGREVLLVLDNCEHLIDAASAFAAAVARQADSTRVLVTSQELLRIPEEHVYRTPVLALPATADLAEAQQAGSVQLLIGRVQARLPAFAMSERNVADIVDICRRLDGLPLAIELAAARVPLLGTSGVRERLNERFHVLTGGERTAARRHQTLRETMAWSHGLLGADERRIFRRIAVFAGSFKLEVAQAALTDDQHDEWAVLEHVAALVDKSLLAVEGTEPARYRLLEIPRAYALERLAEAGETATMKDRHARALLRWFDHGWALDWTTTRKARLERYLPDLDNLRSALDWAEHGETHLHIALVAASGWLWRSAGQKGEGWHRAKAALARVDSSTPASSEARLQTVCAQTALLTQPVPIALAAARRATELYRALGDDQGLFTSLVSLAYAATLASDAETANGATDEMKALIDPAWPTWRPRWDWLVARTFVVSGTSDSLEEMQSLVDEMSRLAEASGDVDRIRTSLLSQQTTASRRGDHREEARLGRLVIALARQDRFDTSDLTHALSRQVVALTELGALDEALAVARETATRPGGEGLLWPMLLTFAFLACKRGRFDAAAVALGRAEAVVVEWNGNVLELIEQRAHGEVMDRLREAFRGEEIERLLDQGRTTTNEEAARIALAE